MTIIELEKYQNNIAELGNLDEYSYENIFKVYTVDGYFMYNILKRVDFPDNIDETLVDYVRVDSKISWTNLSFKMYGTIKLWWLITCFNSIQNPVYLPEPGTILRILKPQYVKSVLDQIKNNGK